jgi:hypothetical protein
MSSSTKDALLARIERTNLVLAVAVVAVSGLLWRGPGMLAAGVGGALACANFWVVRRLGARAVARVLAGGPPGQAVGLVALLFAKMTALFALVWVAVRVLHLEVVPFTMGLSVFVISILLAGLGAGFHSPEEAR